MDAGGRTLLLEAVRGGNIEIVKRVLEKGANLLAMDKTNLTAVHYALQSGNLEMLKWIITEGRHALVRESKAVIPFIKAQK